MPKFFITEPQDIIRSAVNKLVDFVKPTFGPSKHNILIEGLGVMDDGVTVARNFVIGEQAEDAVITIVRQASEKTSNRVKDGTTGSLIILQELLNHPLTDLRKGLEEAKQQLLTVAKIISDVVDLEKVAQFACKNTIVAKQVAELVKKLGADGVITVQDSERTDITTEVVDGYEVESGLLSFYMVDTGKNEATLEKPLVYITKEVITSANDIVPIIEEVMKQDKKNLVIIAEDIKGEALSLIVLNKLQGRFNVVALKAPSYEDEKDNILGDIAAIAGTVVNQNIKDLNFGQVNRVVAARENTLFFADKNEARINQILDDLKTLSGVSKQISEQRLAKLTNGVGIIKVGGLTEEEKKEIRPKIENAVSSTRLALKSGVVDGAGLALSQVETCCEGLNAALKAPRRVLLQNLGEIKDGVIDSVEVLIASIESSVSIAEMLSLTKGIIIRKQENA